MRIAFIGFGEAAASFATSLGAAADFAAFDTALATERGDLIRQRAAAANVALAASAAEAVAGADWVISAVTASSCLAAAQSAAAAIQPRQVFVDINSVSAARKGEAVAIIAAAGADCTACDSETCRWHISKATGIPSVHPLDLLHRADGLS